jgi:hypothetical protein
MTGVAGHGAKLFLYLVNMELEDWHMPGFKTAFAEEPKLWWNNLPRSSRQACCATLVTGVGVTFAIALYYSLLYISQLMAAAVMISLYG